MMKATCILSFLNWEFKKNFSYNSMKTFFLLVYKEYAFWFEFDQSEIAERVLQLKKNMDI